MALKINIILLSRKVTIIYIYTYSYYIELFINFFYLLMKKNIHNNISSNNKYYINNKKSLHLDKKKLYF